MQKYQNNVQTLDGRAIVGASVTVTEFPGGAPATVYNSNGSGVITQPILTNGDGEFAFYAANGRYQLQVTGGGISVAQTITDVILFDPSDGGAIDAEDISYTAPYTGATTRTQDSKNTDLVSASDFDDVDPTGAASSLTGIQAAINAIADGTVLIQPGTYLMNGDITISNKAAGSSVGGHGGFRIEATGVVFTGTGKIIVSGSKRVQINGLDAPGHDICWRGQWWGEYTNLRFRKLLISDSTGPFNSSFWTKFNTCELQTVEFSASGTTACNALTWDNCSFRGSADQGFAATADYAIELNADFNAQDWEFKNCDLSYYNIGIYNVGSGNTTGQVELTFDGCYFDSLVPLPSSRANTRIITKRCHGANELPNIAALTATSRGEQDVFRTDRAAGWAPFSGVNLIPNGDLRLGLQTYVGTGLPIGADGGATITAGTGAGLFGRYLNINQAGTSGTTSFRSKALPFTGRHSCVLVVRSGDGGSYQMRFSFAGLFKNAVTVSGTDPIIFVMTSGSDLAAGTQQNIQILTDNASPFNIDVLYASITYGEGGMPFCHASPFQQLENSITFNPPSIANNAQTTTTITVPGAALGDYATASFSIDLQGVALAAQVSATDTVRVIFTNNTGGALDLGSATLRALVTRRVFA